MAQEGVRCGRMQWNGWPPWEPYTTLVDWDDENCSAFIEAYTQAGPPKDVEPTDTRRTHYLNPPPPEDMPPREASGVPRQAPRRRDMASAFEVDLFEVGAYGTCEYATGREACQRVGADWVFAGCAACNAAMNRTRHHAHAVFRMLGHTNRPAADTIERRSNSERKTRAYAQLAANEQAKLLQQCTFYFCRDSSDTRWVTRTDDDIKLCAYVYRMAANLVLWGEERSFRHLAIAVLYASLYVRHALVKAVTFEVSAASSKATQNALSSSPPL